MKIIWFVTKECNMNCRYCYLKDTSKYINLSGHLPIDKDCGKPFQLLKTIGGKEIFITGGEPLLIYDSLRPHLFSLNSLDFIITFISNGTLINDKIISDCKKIKNCNFIISLDSSNNSINNLVRGSASKVKDGIDRLISEKIKVYLSCTVTKANIKYIDNLLEFCTHTKISGISFNFVNSLDRSIYKFSDYLELMSLDEGRKEDLFSTIDKCIRLIHGCHQPQVKSYHDIVQDFLIKGIKPKRPCGALREWILMSPDLNLFPCYKKTNTYIGNILKDSVLDIQTQIIRIRSNIIKDYKKCISDDCLCFFRDF